MYSKTLIALVAAIVFVALTSGCGGEGQGNSKPRPAKDKQSTQAKSQIHKGKMHREDTMGKQREAKKRELVDGVVAKTDIQKHVFWVEPKNKDIKLLVFRPGKVKVTLDGKEVKPENIEKGQRAAVSFVTVKAVHKDVEWNVARSVRLTSRGEKTG